LARRIQHAVFLPVAMELSFWNQPAPEILVRFGPAIHREAVQASAAEWNHRLEHALTETQDKLALEARHRDPREFRCLLKGRRGGAPVYDAWRWIMATLSGAPVAREHGER